MRPLRLLAALVVIAGAALTLRAAYMHGKAELAGILIRRAWSKTIESGRPHAPWSWADTHPVARLRIPRLGYEEIVLEGATRICQRDPHTIWPSARHWDTRGKGVFQWSETAAEEQRQQLAGAVVTGAVNQI